MDVEARQSRQENPQSNEGSILAELDRLETQLCRNAQLHTVILLDSILCFTEPQWEKAQSIVEQHWRSGWNDTMSEMSLRIWGKDRLKIIEAIDFSELEPLLSQLQVDALRTIEDLASYDFNRQLNQKQDNREQGLAKARSAFEKLMDLKLAELRTVAKTSEQQSRLLRVARRGVISQTLDRWRSVQEAFEADSQDQKRIDDAMALVRRPLLFQCIHDDVWRTTLNKVFDEVQKQEILSRESKRVAATKQQFANDLVIFWFLKKGELTARQYEDLTQLVNDHLELASGLEMLIAEKQIAEIPAENFQEILNDTQWKKIEPVLNYMRRR